MENIFAVDMVKVFNEDFPVLEAQQRMLELKPAAPRIDIKVDADKGTVIASTEDPADADDHGDKAD